MTTDPKQNRYISNFLSIRTVQTNLSDGARNYSIPKIDNRNIDRSIETMHQTIFSYLKKLEGNSTMFNLDTNKLTFLDDVWKVRKKKLIKKNDALKDIKKLNKSRSNQIESNSNDQINNDFINNLLDFLPQKGKKSLQDDSNNEFSYNKFGVLIISNKEPKIDDIAEAIPSICNLEENDCDPADITLTDFDTTDSEFHEKN